MVAIGIVDVINALRGPGKIEMAHKTFMEKVRNHPGINGQNFLHIYSDVLGRQKPCFYLPKREAELMVMSESLEVQTKVYDRLANQCLGELSSLAVTSAPITSNRAASIF